MIKGKILLAEPSIYRDQNFHRSTVIIVDDKDSSILGFILNKPLDYTLNEIVPDIKINLPIYFGGPVDQENLFLIHNAGNIIPGSQKICKNLFWGGDFDKIVALVNNKILTKKDIRFFLGYSGWSVNQLKNEIAAKSWIVTENFFSDEIFILKPETLWKKQMVSLGGKYIIWSNTPENPYHN